VGGNRKFILAREFIFSFQEKHNMEVTREGLKPEIDQFNDEPIKPVAEFVDLIKFRHRLSQLFCLLHF
jgi:hypothetical protein